jgi:hypothetical protein
MGTGTHSHTVVIAHRYRGPPDSANGGYACGLLACHLHGAARVRLHRPPPLDRPLTLRAESDTLVQLLDHGDVIAEGEPSDATWPVPPTVDLKLATQAAQKYAWYEGHPFASCFVCGPERSAGDGLRIFPGAIPERSVVAAAWIPDDSICDASARVQPEIMWAALDCPSWFGILAFEPDAKYALLGQMTTRILQCPSAHDRCVVIGWTAGRAGRKLQGGTAIYNSEGRLVGSSSAIWIELKT